MSKHRQPTAPADAELVLREQVTIALAELAGAAHEGFLALAWDRPGGTAFWPLMYVTRSAAIHPPATTSTANARSTRPSGKSPAPTNGTSPTSSSATCGPTTPDDTRPVQSPSQRGPLDKRASSR
jgi:hypothetical protein